MGRRAILLAALLWAGGAAAETITFEQGPIELRGLHDHMQGPGKTERVQFPGPGWIRGMSVTVLDAAKRPRASNILCHTIFGAAKDGLKDIDQDGVANIEPLHISLSDGALDMKLPEGYGLYVDQRLKDVLSSMLVSEDLKNDGVYSVRVQFDFVPESSGAKLKTLEDLTVRTLRPAGHHGAGHHGGSCGDAFMWDVPPGHHEYRQEFSPPFSATAYYVWVHLHQHTSRVSLKDEETGQVLLDSPVDNGPDGWPKRLPSASLPDGLKLLKGHRYVYETVFDNPLKKPFWSMSILRFYIRRDPPVRPSAGQSLARTP